MGGGAVAAQPQAHANATLLIRANRIVPCYHASVAWARVTTAALALTCGSCGPQQDGSYPGASDAVPEGPAPSASVKPEPTPTKWALWDAVQTWPIANRASFRSLGHAGVGDVDIRVQPEHLDRYRSLVVDTTWPQGITLVETLRGPATPTAGAYAMTRLRDQTWRFLVIDGKGMIQQTGPLPLCTRCHAEAVAGYVFGLPTDQRPVAESDAGVDG